MSSIGLSFDEYVDLKLRPPAGASRPIQRGFEAQVAEKFPMDTHSASGHLRSRGYDCRPAMLELLVTNGVVKLAQPDVWTQADVDAAAEHFEECGIYVPYAAMCQAMGCSYAEFLRPLKEAAESESEKWGRHIHPNDQYFVMHRMPPRSDSQAIITFTLCDDIRERLERGEVI